MLISWVNKCINEVMFFININGVLEDYFPSNTSFRQGWHLYHFLFYIVMVGFSNLLQNYTSNGICSSVTLEGDSFSHILYANVVLSFGKASAQNMVNFRNFLQMFYLISNLKVNIRKRTIYFSKKILNSLSLTNIIGSQHEDPSFT